MWLYFITLVLSGIVPLAASFDKNMQLHKKWKTIFPSMLVVALFYIVADIYLTREAVWGFNPSYHLGITSFGLPLEEWLFFVIIPYACLFVHYTIIHYLPDAKIPHKSGRIITVSLAVMFVGFALLNASKMYTLYASILTATALILSLFDKKESVNRLYISYVVMVIPFLIVNGILTGSFLGKTVVWYNPEEIFGLRVLTIPVEDFAYGFSLVLFNLLTINRIESIQNNRKAMQR